MNTTIIFTEMQDERAERNLRLAEAYKPYVYEDMRSYKSAMEREDYNKAVADAEQVAEKSLKSIAQKNGRLSNRMKKEKGHDLKYLARECGSNIPASETELTFLSNGYFSARYPEGNKKYNRNEAEQCGRVACKCVDAMIEELDIQNQELDKEIGGKEKTTIDDFKAWNRLMESRAI